MDYTIKQSEITLKFKDSKDAFNLFNTILLYKHYNERDHEGLQVLSSNHWFSSRVLKLGEAINLVLPNLVHDKFDREFFSTIELNETDPHVKIIADRLMAKYRAYDGKGGLNYIIDDVSRSRNWVRRFFAPALIEDELADTIVMKLRAIRDADNHHFIDDMNDN